MKIDTVAARAIPDTRGKPTVEATLRAGEFGAVASVPSGKSTGSHEARELRDADGGVNDAIANVNGEIAALLTSREWQSPDEIDEGLVALDGTADKSRLGANVILAASIAAQRLFARATGVPLWRAIAKRAGTTPAMPRFFLNMLEGGVHADYALPFQEHLLVIGGPAAAALETAKAAFAELRTLLPDAPEGDEGGYAPRLAQLEEPFELLAGIAAKHPGTTLAIDAAANELWKDGAYELIGKKYSAAELAGLYVELTGRFSLASIEDPFREDADADFENLTARLGGKTLIVGDDFTVTNPARIQQSIEERAINAVLIKPNQIGTVKKAIEAVALTYAAGWKAICSHRSGETMDTFIADFAYGVGAWGLKAGGLGQPERLAKYDRLLAIETEFKSV